MIIEGITIVGHKIIIKLIPELSSHMTYLEIFIITDLSSQILFG